MRNRNLRLVACAALSLLPFAAPARLVATEAGENFDLRLVEPGDDKEARRELVERRSRYAASADAITAIETAMRSAREELARRLPALYLLESEETGAPEVIGVSRGRAMLTTPSSEPRERIARRFVEEHAALWGLARAQDAGLETDADYTNPASNLSWVRLEQRLAGLSVFRGTLTLAFTPAGEIARATGQLASGLPAAASNGVPRLTAAEAVSAASATLGRSVDPTRLRLKESSIDGSRFVFESGPFTDDVSAELLWFPLGRERRRLSDKSSIDGNPGVCGAGIARNCRVETARRECLRETR